MQTNNSIIKLNFERIKEINLDKYEKDFTFIVNHEQYETCNLIADLLSPKICQLRLIDPTIKEYSITTNSSGDFQHIINLINFEDQIISDDEIPFISEILTILENKSIQIKITEPDINITTSFDILNKYYKRNFFYASQIDKCIDFISTNFDEVVKQSHEKFINLNRDLIDMILSNKKLRLESEDQLLSIVNELYQMDSQNSFFYKYVNFVNVSKNAICEFLDIFDFNDVDHEIWERLSLRIRQDEKNDESKGEDDDFKLDKRNEIKGIFYYMKNEGILKNEIKITNTQLYTSKDSADYLFLFDENAKYFESKDVQNAFICFEFKSKKLIPTGYQIKTTSCNTFTPRTWVIEASNDGVNWEIIDNQSNQNLKNNNRWWNFKINNQNMKRYKYIQFRQTGVNSHSNNYLVIGSIDFEGYLI